MRWQNLELDNFNGPLDLLNHMIKEKEINIMDVNLIELSNQYIDYLTSLENLNIEIASEYLVMAAYLLELKSKLLIPIEEVEMSDDYEDIQREDFLRRLVEYHKIKELSNYFKEKQVDFLNTYSKDKSIIKVTKIDDDELPLEPNMIPIDKFAKVFLKIIEKKQKETIEEKTITTNEISPEEMAKKIIHILKSCEREIWHLEELLDDEIFSIQIMVATFLAILDLVKNSFVSISQEDNDDIKVIYLPEGKKNYAEQE